MADLWELVKEDAVGRIPTHYIVAGLKGRQVNIENSSVGFTAAQILDGINALRAADGLPALTSGEQSDLSGINSTLEGQPNANARLVFTNLVEALFIAAELGQINETKWRNDLGI